MTDEELAALGDELWPGVLKVLQTDPESRAWADQHTPEELRHWFRGRQFDDLQDLLAKQRGDPLPDRRSANYRRARKLTCHLQEMPTDDAGKERWVREFFKGKKNRPDRLERMQIEWWALMHAHFPKPPGGMSREESARWFRQEAERAAQEALHLTSSPSPVRAGWPDPPA